MQILRHQHFRRWFTPYSAASALLACVTMLGMSGCGASFPSTISVPSVEIAPTKSAGERISTSTFLYVDEFLDKRDSKVVTTVDGKSVSMDGDAVAPVVAALKSSLTKRGFAFSDAAPVILSGELRTWRAEVSGSLPTKIEAESAVFIEVLDPANKRIYSGVYRGFANTESGSPGDKELKKTLASALEEAVLQISRDGQLVSLLSSY